ncbi:MAG: S8 family serine peptidase [Bacteriovoracaceae bacterium]
MKKFSTLSAFVMLGCLSSATYAGVVKAIETVPGELIVKFKEGKGKSFLQSKRRDFKNSQAINVSFGEFYKITVNSKSDLSSTIKALNEDPMIEYAEPNFIYRVGDYEVDAPLDPKFNVLWGLKNTGNNEPDKNGNPSGVAGVVGADIAALKAWDVTMGSKAVKIAVIDTGIDYNHPDLKNNIAINEAEKNGAAGVDDDKNGYVDDIYGYDFANNDADPMDGHSHGTHCSGTIAGEHNSIGVSGVMAEASLVPIKFLADNGSGSTEAAIQAIDYATKRGVDVMSNSWGGGGFSKALEDAIKRANEAGIVFIAAAGNDSANNDTTPHYPSSYNLPNVISVAAFKSDDTLASFSCFGKRSVHIAAPGNNILSTIHNSGYAVYSGTSMATPHVSGVVGLLLSHEPNLTPAEVSARIMQTSVPIRAYRSKTISGGRINAFNALTNFKPPREEPNPNLWVKSNIEKFESTHPYANSANVEKVYKVPGAKYIRVLIEKFELENGYDFLILQDGKGQEAEKISGAGESYVTEYVEGDSFKLKFSSDSSLNKWGYSIKQIEVIK